MMKKAIVLLTALAVAAGFTGCQRESSFQSQEPQAASGKKVNTQLVLNVATSTAQTKQTAEAVQVSGGFQGLKDAYLLTYTQDGDGKILAEAAPASQDPIELNQLFSTDVTRRVVSVKLPVNTNTLVLYGRGLKTENPNQYGTLAQPNGYSVAKNVGDSHFDLGARLPDVSDFDDAKNALAGMLTTIMGSTLDGAEFTLDGITVKETEYASCKAWADYSNITTESKVEPNTACYVWEEKLAYLYNQMTGITYDPADAGFPNNVELRAGSGKAIREMIAGVWKAIYPITQADATSKAEAVAKKLALKIVDNIDDYFEYTITGTAPNEVWTVTFNSANAVYTNFPTNFNLMEGIAYLKFNPSDKTFSYPQNWTGMGGFDLKATDIFYPAPLLYFGNSPVRADAIEYSISEYPSTTSWNTYNWAGEWTNSTSHVTDKSLSVAMVKNIRYGVAMLETEVKYTDAVSGSISTNNPNNPTETMSVQSGTFQLTGVIVGGQPKRVGWDFLPEINTEGGFTYGEGFIFDDCVTPINIPFPAGKKNYTVVFDNYNAKAAKVTKQNTVYVALEFVNNGDKDFYGKNNWIRKGDKFYLVGVLDPGDPNNTTANPVKTVTWPDDNDCAIPPYDADGKSKKTPRIFIQDYMTTVTFKIGPYSLKYAYNTLPDLRSTSMTLGLSVDITWRQGLKYEEVIVGGTE